MPNDAVKTVYTGSDGLQVVSERMLTDEEQAAKNRGLRLGQFKVNGSPSQAETARALQDLMEQLGM